MLIRSVHKITLCCYWFANWMFRVHSFPSE